MTVSQIGQRAAKVKTVLNRRTVVHGSEEVLLDGEDHQLLKDLITHQELLCSTRNVSVVVQNSHACETGDLYLNSNITGQISVNLSLFSWVNTGVQGS